MSKILILSSHHDDETLGAGATIARLSADGHEVHVMVMGPGPSARDEADVTICDHVIGHHKSALRHLGAQYIPFTGEWLYDNQFDAVPLLDLVKRIERILKNLCPDVIYTHHGRDLNVDHKAVYEATLVATRLSGQYPVKELYTYEVPSSTETAFNHSFHPNTFSDISGEYLEKKIAAMEMYETERRAFPHPRSPEALRALAMYRGSQAGLIAAEAFHLVRRVV